MFTYTERSFCMSIMTKWLLTKWLLARFPIRSLRGEEERRGRTFEVVTVGISHETRESSQSAAISPSLGLWRISSLTT